MAISKEELEKALALGFPDGEITIRDLAGDNDHWSVEIVDGSFKGKPRIKQHKMVQDAVKSHDIHALQIKTSHPHVIPAKAGIQDE